MKKVGGDDLWLGRQLVGLAVEIRQLVGTTVGRESSWWGRQLVGKTGGRVDSWLGMQLVWTTVGRKDS